MRACAMDTERVCLSAADVQNLGNVEGGVSIEKTNEGDTELTGSLNTYPRAGNRVSRELDDKADTPGDPSDVNDSSNNTMMASQSI